MYLLPSLLRTRWAPEKLSKLSTLSNSLKKLHVKNVHEIVIAILSKWLWLPTTRKKRTWKIPQKCGRMKELDVWKSWMSGKLDIWKAGCLKSWTSESWMSVCPSQLLLPCFLAFRVYSFTFQSDGSDCPAIVSSEQDQISQPKLQGWFLLTCIVSLKLHITRLIRYPAWSTYPLK